MEEKLNTLYEICEIVERELEEAAEKMRQSGSKLTAGDVDYIDKLTHTMKSIKTTIAMIESEGRGYSSHFPIAEPRGYREGGSYRNSYNNSYDSGYEGGSSYRGRSMRRDNMDRY